MVIWVVLSIGSWGMWWDLVGIFAGKLNAFNEYFLVVGKWILVGVNVFFFGAIVLSKVNVLLGLLMWIYALRREVLVIVGCYLIYAIGECHFSCDDFPFGSLVKCFDEDYSDCWLLYVFMLIVFMVRDEFVLDSMKCWLWGVILS